MKSLLSSCAAAGIAEWVYCPSPQPCPLQEALQSCKELELWPTPHEQLAAPFALGRIQATSTPVALLASSTAAASATLPALMEAYYQRRPLLLLTLEQADAPSGSQESADEGLFGPLIPRIEMQLPCAAAEIPPLRELLAEGFPLHLHVRLHEGYSAKVDELSLNLPPAPPRFRGSLGNVARMLRFDAFDGLIVMIGSLEVNERPTAYWLAHELRAPVIADATSGLREELSALAFHMPEQYLNETPPRYVLRMGETPSSPVWGMLEHMPQTTVYSLTRSGFAGLRRESEVIEGDLEQIIKGLGEIPRVGDTWDWLATSRRYSSKSEEQVLCAPESREAMLRELSQFCALCDLLFIAPPLLPLWNRFAQTQIPTSFARSQCLSGFGLMASFFAHSIEAPASFCVMDEASFRRDEEALRCLPLLPAAHRVIAVFHEEPNDAPRLSEICALYQVEYHAVYAAEDFDLLNFETTDYPQLRVLEIFS